MATIKSIVGARNSLAYTGSGLSTLASATYVQNTTAYNCTTNQPLDVVIEVDITPGNAVAGNKQALVFISESLDGTNYRSGPTSGTTATREPNLRMLGVLPLTTNSQAEKGMFSIVQGLGYVPYDFFIIIRNDSGQAFAAGTVFTSEISNTVT